MTVHVLGETELKGGVMAKDPVCSMDVNPKEAAGRSEYKGVTYYFCGPSCKKAFDENPEKFVGEG